MCVSRSEASSQRITFYSYLGISSDPYFYWLVAAYSFVCIINVALVFLNPNPSSLSLTYPQWWGIVTEITIFDTPQTLLGIILSIMLLALVNACLTQSGRKNRTLFFLMTTFVAAIGANYAWYISPAARLSSTHGASQIAYAADAILIVFASFNLLYSYEFPNEKSTKVTLPKHTGLKKFWNLSNVGILASMIIVPTLVPPTLIQPSPGINTFDHAVAFSISFVAALVFELVGLYRSRR